VDRWESLPVICKGGIHTELDTLTLGTTMPGAATILQNYEPSVAGGYARVQGYSKWDAATVPGDANTPVLGVCVWLGGVFASRFATGTSSNDVYFSAGSGWSKINTSTRPGVVSKMRMLNYSLGNQAIIITDGVNAAAKYDGTTYTVINGTGAPTNPKYAEYFNGHIVLAGYGTGNAANTKVSISASNSDTDFDGGHGAVELNVGDVAVGIHRFRDTLYIFCETSIYQLTGTDASDFQLDSVTKSIGCISGDTVIEVGGDLIFLAPDGFRSLAATYRIGDLQLGLLSRPIHQLLINNNFLQGFGPDSYSAVHIHEKNQYRCWVYDSSQTKQNNFGVLGKRLDDPVNVSYEWGTLLGIQPYCAHSEFITNQEVIVIGDPKTGFVYRLESGNDFDGSAVSYVYRTPDLTFSDSGLRKVVQKLALYTQALGNIDLSFNVQTDFQIPGSLQPDAINITYTSSGALYGSGIYGTSIYSSVQFPLFKFPIVGAGFLVAFQFSGTDSLPPHRIDSFNIEFSPKGRR
jgi:hypothetical protein